MTRFFALLLAVSFAIAAPAAAEVPSPEKAIADRVLGRADAPVTIIEFASLTCSHCADFHTKTLPQVQKELIDTGKAKLIFRDFPLDGIALRASALARCLPEDRYFPFIKILFERQKNWSMEKDPTESLVKLAALAGLSPDTARACMSNMPILDVITKQRANAAEKYKIQATPTFVFNDGAAKLSGARPVAEFVQVTNRVAKGEKIKEEPVPAAPAGDKHEGHTH